MKIGLIGTGRLGICLALLIEGAGYDVLVSDVREEYVNDLNNRVITTEEPGVQERLKTAKNFEATTNNHKVIKECDLIFTLVATPSLSDGSYNVNAVYDVIRDIQTAGDVSGKTFIVGCTTNPGDCARFQNLLTSYGVNVVYNPEFIAQGTIIKDLINADMVLIGGANDESFEVLEKIYKDIQIKKPKVGRMSSTAAELVKLAVNCYLTTKISYANMVGEVMTVAGLEDEIDTVLTSIGNDSRVGNKYLKYGYGFGGPCLPRDNRSFAAFAKKQGLVYNLGETTDNFNRQHSKFLRNYFINKNKDNLPFYFSYISYKKGTDILTESQQYILCRDLLDAGYTVYIDDIDSIIEQVKDTLTKHYGNKVQFGLPPKNISTIEINI
jgi:nucleotide sugar dehydrogenase